MANTYKIPSNLAGASDHYAANEPATIVVEDLPNQQHRVVIYRRLRNHRLPTLISDEIMSNADYIWHIRPMLDMATSRMQHA